MIISDTDIDALTRKLADDGRLIDSGWIAYHRVALPHASEAELSELRTAFFAGAQHLFALLSQCAGSEHYGAAFDSVTIELTKFVDAELLLRCRPAEGHG
jgi:hypothetical protein